MMSIEKCKKKGSSDRPTGVYRTITDVEQAGVMREVGQEMGVGVRLIASEGVKYISRAGFEATVEDGKTRVEIRRERIYEEERGVDLGPFYNEVERRLQLREQQE